MGEAESTLLRGGELFRAGAGSLGGPGRLLRVVWAGPGLGSLVHWLPTLRVEHEREG